MQQHKYVDKEEMIKDYNPEQEEWKWVLQIKPKGIKKYGRFWRPETKPENKK